MGLPVLLLQMDYVVLQTVRPIRRMRTVTDLIFNVQEAMHLSHSFQHQEIQHAGCVEDVMVAMTLLNVLHRDRALVSVVPRQKHMIGMRQLLVLIHCVEQAHQWDQWLSQ